MCWYVRRGEEDECMQQCLILSLKFDLNEPDRIHCGKAHTGIIDQKPPCWGRAHEIARSLPH